MLSKIILFLIISCSSASGWVYYTLSDSFQNIVKEAYTKPKSQIAALQELDKVLNEGGSFENVALAQTKDLKSERLRARYSQLNEMNLSKDQIVEELYASMRAEQMNYDCSAELAKYKNLPELASYEKLNDMLCNNADDEAFYTAFIKNFKDGLNTLFKS